MARYKRNRELTLIGIEIKKRLLDKNMSQAELARKIGTSRNYITDIVHGRYAFEKSNVMEKILEELKIDKYEILNLKKK